MKPAVKYILAHASLLLGYTSWSETRRDLQYGSYIRMVSYHDIPPSETTSLEDHFRFFAKHYHPATWSDVRFVIDGGVWPHKKPGIIFSFDDGAITNYTIAAPLLKEYDFQAIFLIVPDWVDCQIEEQTQYAKEHSISSPADYLESPRKAMSWEQVANLSKQGHAIASHTRTHHRFTSQDSPRRIKDEVERSRMIFTERIGITPEIFSWVGGEISVYQPAVYKAVLEAGYNYTLSTCAMPLQAGVHPHLVGRTALASSFPVSLVRLVLLPSYDGKYAIKDSKIRSRFGIERRLS